MEAMIYALQCDEVGATPQRRVIICREGSKLEPRKN